MSLIYCGKLKWHLLFPIFASIFITIAYGLISLFNIKNEPNLNSPNDHTGLLIFALYIGEILAGMLECISIYIQKPHKSPKPQIQIEPNNSTAQLEQLNNSQKIKLLNSPKLIKSKFSLKLIIICTILDFIGYTLNTFAIKSIFTISLSSELINIQMILLALLSKIILKDKIYRHHAFAIVLMLCGMFINVPSMIFSLKSKEYNQISIYETSLLMILYILSMVCFSITVVLEKKIMYSSCSPYKLLFYKGIFGTIISFIFLFVIGSIFCSQTNSDETYGKKDHLICIPAEPFYFLLQEFKMIGNATSLLYLIAIIIIGSLYNLLYVLTNFFFSPCHSGVTDVLSGIGTFVVFLLKKELLKDKVEKLFYIIPHLVGYIITIFGILIFNEIVICNVCQMEENTDLLIANRGDFEVGQNRGILDISKEEDSDSETTSYVQSEIFTYLNN